MSNTRASRTVATVGRTRTTFTRASNAPSASNNWEQVVRDTRIQAIKSHNGNFVDSGQTLPPLPIAFDFSLGLREDVTVTEKMQLLGFIYQLQFRAEKLAAAIAVGDEVRATKLRQKFSRESEEIALLQRPIGATGQASATVLLVTVMSIGLYSTIKARYPAIPRVEQLRDKRRAKYEWDKFMPEIVYLDIPCPKCGLYTLTSTILHINTGDEAGRNETQCFSCGNVTKH